MSKKKSIIDGQDACRLWARASFESPMVNELSKLCRTLKETKSQC